MVEPFAHSESPEFAEAFYGQAYAMLLLLEALCVGLPDCNASELIGALKQERTDPEGLFAWAIESRAGGLGITPMGFLTDFVGNGFRLAKSLEQALSLRAAAKGRAATVAPRSRK
jgi:hypothetical protein